MKNKRMLHGLLCVFISALIFGFTPVLSSISYKGGNNGINMAFLRALLPIPVLLFLGRGLPMPTASQWKRGLIAGGLSFGCTLQLYSSYEFISPGLATTLHFLYPLYVTVFEAVKVRRMPSKQRMLGLVIGLGGMLLFLEATGNASPIGFILALCSGLTYALYIVALGKEAEDPLTLSRLMLVVSISGVILCGLFGLSMGKLTAELTMPAWGYAVCVALLTAIVGSTMFQKGVRVVGEANAALFSLLEPITSIFFSVLLLGDRFTLKNGVGCILIFVSLLLVTRQRQN